jgi:hypothetical protein
MNDSEGEVARMLAQLAANGCTLEADVLATSEVLSLNPETG